MRFSTIYKLIATLWASMALMMVSCEPAFAGPCNQVYAKAGAGYKFDEETKFNIDGSIYERVHVDPYSARFELGCRKGNWTYGVSHHSQWGTGWPVDDRGEPYKTEFFIDYEWSWDLR